jgi:ABC-type polysaccharide/polyol phosphate transport system ATPase subunit
MARIHLSPNLAHAVEFEDVRLQMPRTRRRKGGGRGDRLRRLARETSKVRQDVFSGLSLAVEPGEAVAVIARDRRADTVEFLRLAAGTLIPDHGHVHRRDTVVPILRRAGLLNAKLTVRQNIFVIGILLGMSPEEINERLDWIVETAGLTKALDGYARACPPELRRRIVWTVSMATRARAFATQGSLIVGDESFRETGWAHVEGLKAEGVTFLVAGQNARVMERFCTRAVVIGDGAILLDGTVAEALALVGRGTLQDDDEEIIDDGADVLDADRDEWRAD